MNDLASRFPTRFLRGYARTKLATDPVYAAVLRHLRETELPLIDAGCGVGLLGLYLRSNGFEPPIYGVDHDAGKIGVARAVVNGRSTFCVGDLREPLPSSGNVAFLDVLHYFTESEQLQILQHAISAVPPGGKILIREGIREATIRYGMTYLLELFARMARWLKADRLNFPTRQSIERPFAPSFDLQVEPMFGQLRLNNYLFVFSRSSEGTTNE